VNLCLTIEPLFQNLVMAVYAEVVDNGVKINAIQQVKDYVAQGGIVYKVEDEQNNTFVGIKVILNQQEVFSFNRKTM
jgi:hypothetical protein